MVFFLLNKNRQHVAENHDEPVRIMAASFGRKTMLLSQVFELFWRDLSQRLIANMQKTFVQDWVTQIHSQGVWSHLATMQLAVSSTVCTVRPIWSKLYRYNVWSEIPMWSGTTLYWSVLFHYPTAIFVKAKSLINKAIFEAKISFFRWEMFYY